MPSRDLSRGVKLCLWPLDRTRHDSQRGCQGPVVASGVSMVVSIGTSIHVPAYQKWFRFVQIEGECSA